mgnify:CR=1 FL=1
MRIDVYHHNLIPNDLPWWAREILDRLETIMATMADLTAAVARETDAEDSVLKLLEGISQQLKDAKASGDPAALDAAIAAIDTNTAKLGAAVVANTPAG